MTETPSIFRTYRQGVFKLYESVWGKYLAPTIDPDANIVEFTDEHFNMFELNEHIDQIPADLWSAWIDLCFYYADKVNKNVEVSMRILRSETDSSQYKFVIPIQDVSKGSVRAEDFQKSIDLITGEELESYPPAGWIPVGSSHSHNTMRAFFSSTDDTYELSDPGLHIVVGDIDLKKEEYHLKISVTANGRRFEIDKEHETRFIDFEPDENSTYHVKVLNYVKIPDPKELAKKFSGVKTQFVGNFSKESLKNLSKKQSNLNLTNWNGGLGSSSTAVQEIECAILEYLSENEYDHKKLERLYSILQECEDAIAYQLQEIESTLESVLN